MEPSDYQQPSYAQPSGMLSGNPQLVMVLNILIVLAVLGCVMMIYLLVAGYGKLELTLPADTTVKLNGHVVSPSSTLRLRPGDYQVVVSSPTITPKQDTLHVGILKTTAYGPKLTQRSADAIASSAIGAVGQNGPPRLSHVQWFENNTWVVGIVAPGSADLALHYDTTSHQWSVGFFNFTNSGYPNDPTKLPSDVAAYITYAELHYAGG